MKPSQAIALHRDPIRRFVISHRAHNPRVFNSALCGGDTERSDVDLPQGFRDRVIAEAAFRDLRVDWAAEGQQP